MSDRTVLRCRGLGKRFGETVAVDAFDLDVREGELVALLGPSGCGKTTALRLIAGLEVPDAGTIDVGERRVADDRTLVPPERRHVGLVFQDWALFPHLTVGANIAFGLREPGGDRVRELLSLVRLDGLADRMPHELSGGQQQRVAVARALAPRPDIVLLDEPFSNLDAQLRGRVREEVREVLRASVATALIVTHDQDEALSLADRVAVMSDGRVLQTGPPHEVYATPAHRTVARLLGGGNLVEVVVRGGSAASALGPLATTDLDDGIYEALVRPEALVVTSDPMSPIRVERVEYYGHDQVIRCRLEDSTVVEARVFRVDDPIAEGDRVRLTVDGPVRYFPLGAFDAPT